MMAGGGRGNFGSQQAEYAHRLSFRKTLIKITPLVGTRFDKTPYLDMMLSI